MGPSALGSSRRVTLGNTFSPPLQGCQIKYTKWVSRIYITEINPRGQYLSFVGLSQGCPHPQLAGEGIPEGVEAALHETFLQPRRIKRIGVIQTEIHLQKNDMTDPPIRSDMIIDIKTNRLLAYVTEDPRFLLFNSVFLSGSEDYSDHESWGQRHKKGTPPSIIYPRAGELFFSPHFPAATPVAGLLHQNSGFWLACTLRFKNIEKAKSSGLLRILSENAAKEIQYAFDYNRKQSAALGIDIRFNALTGEFYAEGYTSLSEILTPIIRSGSLYTGQLISKNFPINWAEFFPSKPKLKLTTNSKASTGKTSKSEKKLKLMPMFDKDSRRRTGTRPFSYDELLALYKKYNNKRVPVGVAREIFGLEKGSDHTKLKQAYRVFAETFDPAINQGPTREEKENILKLITAAYKVLKGRKKV